MNHNKRDSDKFYSPYRRANNYQSKRNQNKDTFIRLNESNALIYVHPSSNYNKGYPEISQPVEIGILPSDSKN